MTENNLPVWQRPKWIAVITSLLALILTLPSVLTDYLVQHQKIDDLRQEKEIKLVRETLAQQGEERIFLLRYLASTNDDKQVKDWAMEEVKRLDELVKREAEIGKLKSEIEEINSILKFSDQDKDKLQLQISELKRKLDEQKRDKDKLANQAGLRTIGRTLPTIQLLFFRLNENLTFEEVEKFNNELPLKTQVTINKDGKRMYIPGEGFRCDAITYDTENVTGMNMSLMCIVNIDSVPDGRTQFFAPKKMFAQYGHFSLLVGTRSSKSIEYDAIFQLDYTYCYNKESYPLYYECGNSP